MASKVTTFGKCIKCNYKIGSKQNKLQCKQCSYLSRQKLTNIKSREYSKDFKTGKRESISQYCADYSCLVCDKHVYDRQNGVRCDL